MISFQIPEYFAPFRKLSDYCNYVQLIVWQHFEHSAQEGDSFSASAFLVVSLCFISALLRLIRSTSIG